SASARACCLRESLKTSKLGRILRARTIGPSPNLNQPNLRYVAVFCVLYNISTLYILFYLFFLSPSYGIAGLLGLNGSNNVRSLTFRKSLSEIVRNALTNT